MREDLNATIMQIAGIRDMRYAPNSLGYRTLTNAIRYLKELEDLKSDPEDSDEQGTAQEI